MLHYYNIIFKSDYVHNKKKSVCFKKILHALKLQKEIKYYYEFILKKNYARECVFYVIY